MHIDNSPLIDGVKRLKDKSVIRRDSEVAEAMGYSKGVVSEYLNNKKPVSELFLKKFFEKFPEANFHVGESKNENMGTSVQSSELQSKLIKLLEERVALESEKSRRLEEENRKLKEENQLLIAKLGKRPAN